MDTTLFDDVRTATMWSIVLSVLMMTAGLVGLFVPAISGLAVTLVLGWLLIVSGFLHLGMAWRARQAGVTVWEILLAVLCAAVGYYLLARPVLGLEALTLALATYLVFESILEFVLAWSLRSVPGSGWLLFDGVVTLLLAVLIWRVWPTSSTWAIGTLAAVSVFFSGLARLIASVAVRRILA